MSAIAECTWGEGPDVLVITDKTNESGYPVMDVGNGHSFGLTSKEARRLAALLLLAADRADELSAGHDDQISGGN